jgi:pimeloyl-ACP methyl ester carboxylesterase
MGKKRWLRPALAVAAVGAAAAMAVPATASAATTPQSGPAAPALNWQSCQGGFQCATAKVPLDYQHPGGQQISLAVMRHQPAGTGKSLGSLFLNQGGPATQLDTFPQAYQQLPVAVRDRYSVVAFDARGFGQSTAVNCFPSQAAEDTFLAALPIFPAGTAQTAAFQRTVTGFDATCAATKDPLLAHDSTADTARDMDLLRQAVGDPVLNYYGESYGTEIGAVYANLFPGRTGRMIFDGNVDPAAFGRNSPLPGWLREGADVGDAQAMAAFLSLCGKAGTTACAFSAGTPAATTAKWNTLLQRLLKQPAAVGSPARVWTYADVNAEFPEYTFASWPDDAAFLQQLWVASAPGHTIPPGTPPLQPLAGAPIEQILATVCSDVPNPRTLAAYPAAATVAFARSGGFGLYSAWQFEPCAQWPAQAATDRYAGPYGRPTASTILVIGNTTDPATPYRDSVAMSRDLSRARLLTVDGYGHTTLENPSACATGYVTSYLNTGKLPAAGATCQQDATPFGVPRG